MPIPTSRTKENGHISIDNEKCDGCGLCVEVCKDFSLELVDHKARVSQQPFFGCFSCGQCMAVCPEDAIRVEGRHLSPDDLFPLPSKEEAASYDGLLNLLSRRRSVRDFKNKRVDQDLIRKVLDAAATAPMGIPPSDVNVLVMESPEKTRKFAVDFCKSLEGMKWFVSPWFLALLRPFIGRETYDLYSSFLRPLIFGYIDSMKEGKNLVTYDAPAALYFYGSPFADPADPVIVATYAMMAAESLGLATCIVGGVHPFTQSGGYAKKFREMNNIRFKSKQGLILLLGYPKVKFRYGIHRSFANIDSVN